jgi:hypothetical protein
VHRLVGFVGWLAATVVASMVSVGAISFLGEGITDRAVAPLRADQVERALARTSAAPAAPASPPPATVAGMTRAFASPGGTVLAQCNGEAAVLRSWSPAQGFAIDKSNLEVGPAKTASIDFDGDDHYYAVQISCQAGQPVATITMTDY